MAVTYTEIVQQDLVSWRIRFSSNQATPVAFRVYRDGRLVSSFNSPDGTGEIILAVGDGEGAFVEVLDRAAQAAQPAFPGRFTLHWRAVSGAKQYRIDEFLSGVWTERQKVPDYGQGYFTWDTRWLPDSQSHQFRIVPIFDGNLESAAISITALMVRHPDTPRVTYTYAAGTQKVTIAAA